LPSHGHCCSPSAYIDSPSSSNHSSLTAIFFCSLWSLTTSEERSSSQTTTTTTYRSLFLAKNTNGNNAENKRSYTKIDDGSPLGVAIVAIGGLLYSDPLGLFSGDNNNNPFLSLLQQDNSAWIIILATASTAAGLERLFRYMSDKQQQ
jgi:hypothetical protein